MQFLKVHSRLIKQLKFIHSPIEIEAVIIRLQIQKGLVQMDSAQNLPPSKKRNTHNPQSIHQNRKWRDISLFPLWSHYYPNTQIMQWLNRKKILYTDIHPMDAFCNLTGRHYCWGQHLHHKSGNSCWCLTIRTLLVVLILMEGILHMTRGEK